jgi:hypothetical protein
MKILVTGCAGTPAGAPPIGKQDQYIRALGGSRDLCFGPGNQVTCEELGLRLETFGSHAVLNVAHSIWS